jgi:uncharacterized membrane protein
MMRVGLRQLTRPLCYVMALLYAITGSLHFVEPALYVQIVPSVLPAPLARVILVRLSTN